MLKVARVKDEGAVSGNHKPLARAWADYTPPATVSARKFYAPAGPEHENSLERTLNREQISPGARRDSEDFFQPSGGSVRPRLRASFKLQIAC